MRTPILFIGIFCGMAAHAQTIITFTVDQPPKFEVDAGDELTWEPGLTLQVTASGGTGTYSYLWQPQQYLDDPTLPAPEVQGLLSSMLFTVQVTDIGLGCTLGDQVQVYFFSGIQEAGEAPVTVFPNPSEGMVHIRSEVASQRVQLRSLSGAVVMEYSGFAKRELDLDISSLTGGIYFMTIEFVDGSSHIHKLCATTAH